MPEDLIGLEAAKSRWRLDHMPGSLAQNEARDRM
jgi:hypothetical protein